MRRLASIFLVACSSSGSDPAPAAPANPDAPRLVFVDGAEVDTIVFTDRFGVRIEGVAPGAEVTLEAKSYSPVSTGRGYASTNTFVADEHGVVDTQTTAPVRGTYEGVDPDGIVWSMTEGPLPEGLGARSSMFFHVESGGKVADRTLARLSYASNVTVTEVKEGGLVASLYLPSGASDRIPVIAFGGSEGGISGGQTFAARFASWGYPTLAVAYFGIDPLPHELANVPLEYFQKAFAYLDQQPGVKHGKAIVVGASRGGELALLLGATYPDVVAGVVGITPSAYVWAGNSATDLHAKAWTFGGAALAEIPASTFGPPPTVDGPNGETAYHLRSTFEADLAAASPSVLEAARIKIEKTSAPLLLVGGDDDQLWPACTFLDRAKAARAGRTGDVATCYPSAGHLLEETGIPQTGSRFGSADGNLVLLGGTPKGNAASGRAIDDAIHAFLDAHAR